MSGMHTTDSRTGLTTSGGDEREESPVAAGEDMSTLVGEYGLNMDIETDGVPLTPLKSAAATPLEGEPHTHLVVHVAEGAAKKQGVSIANTYAAKKTVAQGMMDIALITANANQLRYLLEFGQNSSAYYLVMVLISSSLLIQVVIGMALIFKGRYDMTGEAKHDKAILLNNIVVIGVFMVTIINVFVASFSFSSNDRIVPLLPSSPLAPPPVSPSIPALSGGGDGGYAT